MLPNFIWGHPEFNDDPKIMQAIDEELRDFPRRPWQMHHAGKFSLLFAIIDLLVTIVIATTAGCLSEIIIRDNDWQIDSHISVKFSILLTTALCIPFLLTPHAMLYAVTVLAVLLTALIAIAKVLSVGYRHS